MISSTRSNLNEQRPEGLREAKKKIQDRKAEINTRGPMQMTREQKKEENKRLNSLIQQYEDVIDKRKPGPKTGRK